MVDTLSSAILRVVTAPYAVSLINLSFALKASRPHEIQSWADSHPCQIKALAKAAVDALQYCPYALAVIEQLGIVAQLQEEMLQQKPVLLDALMRNALQDDISFEKFAPVLIALLSNPLPPNSPPPAKLVAFFMECLDKATKAPTINTIRPLYVLVANGYKHLTLLMTECQSYTFTRRMAGLLIEKESEDMNVFLTYCLTTLAHMHLASGESKPGDQRNAIADIFQGKKAPTVLNLIINIVNHFASPESQIDWQEKVQIVKMATVIANAIGDPVKTNGATSVDAANLRRLLEKAKAQGDTRVVSGVLQFVSALSTITPQPPLNATIQELVRRKRTDETKGMFLPLISVGFFAQTTSQELIGDMLRSLLRSALSTNGSRSLYLLLQDHLEFVQQLNKVVSQSHSLREGIIGVLSTTEFASLLDTFVRNSTSNSAACKSCEEGGVCRWVISNLTNQLQLALCTLVLSCALYSQGDEARLSPPMATALMEKLARISGIQHKCAFEHSLNTRTAHDTLSLIEEFASPEARISSRNWRQTLAEGLSRDSDRQHEFIVSTVGEICRDLERRCEDAEKPLRLEEEHSRRLQAKLDECKAKNTDVEEQLGECVHNLDLLAREKGRLENKLGGAISKSRDALERVKELERTLEREREDSKFSITGLQQDLVDEKAAYIKELRAIKDSMGQAVMEHLAALSERQDTIDELESHKKEQEQEMDDIKDHLFFLQEDNDQLEDTTESLRKTLTEMGHDLDDSKARVDELSREKDILITDRTRLQENCGILETTLTGAQQAVDCCKLSVKEKISELERQDMIIDELIYEKRQQNVQLDSLRRTRDELDGKILELQAAIEKAINDGKQTCEKASTELVSRYDEQLSKAKSDHNEEIEKLLADHETAIEQFKAKLDQTRKDWSKERDSQRIEISSLHEKLNQFRAIHEEREKEAQNLGRQLLGLMSGSADLANLLSTKTAGTTLDSLSDVTSANMPSSTKPGCINGSEQPLISLDTVPRRRKSDEFNPDERGNATPKRLKTTISSPTMYSVSKCKVTRTHRRRDGPVPAPVTMATGKKSVTIEQSEDIVKETPTCPGEMDYGTAPVLTSTPKAVADVSSPYDAWDIATRSSRRKAGPVLQLPAQVRDWEDDVEEEALKGLLQQWDTDDTI